MKTFLLTSGLLLSIAATAIPPVPPMISYQGHVTVNGVDAEKKGFFKFALIVSRAAFLWSNDGTREREPGLSVALDLNRGLFSVMLGDGTLGMQEIAATVFQTPRVFLRIWFSADGRAFQQLTPDQPITTVGYAFMAENVPNASVTAAKLANSSITLSKISPAGATAGQALMFDGTSLVWQKVNVSQIDGLLGQSYASVFPDGLDNTALIDIDSVGTLEAV